MPPDARPTPHHRAWFPFRAWAWAVLLLGLLGASPRAWCGETIAVQLGWHAQFQFAGYYLAKERGHYEAAGLDVEIRHGGPASPRPVDAVIQDRAQFGVGNAGLAIDRMNGAPVVALAAVLQSSPAVWVVRGRRDPMDLAAWMDLRASVPFRAQDSAELLIPFVRAGHWERGRVDGSHRRLDTLRDIDNGPPGMWAAYLSHEVFDLTQRGETFSVLDPRDHGVDFYSEVLFTSEAFLRSRPGTAARFRAATLRGWEEAFADVEATARLVQRLYAPSIPLEALVHEGHVLRRLARVDTVALGHMSPRRWEAIAGAQREAGFGQSALDVSAFVRDGVVPTVPLWPDPVRVTLVGLVVALILAGVQLLRVNGRLLRSNQALAEAGQAQQAEGLRFQFLMDVAPFPIVIYAMADGRVLYANDRALAWSGAADMSGRAIHDWIAPLAPGGGLAARLRGGRSLRDHELELPGGHDGQGRWCSVTGRAIEYDGQHCAFVAVSDITDRKATERDLAMVSEQRALILRDVEKLQVRLREASLHDALTGLRNRRYLDSTAEREFARCRRERQTVGLLVIDADHFKAVNDHHGHAGGDEVLRALGAILARSFRVEDIVCRFGGEEFVVLMPGADAASTLARAEAVRQAVEACEVSTPSGVARVTVSVGAALGHPATDTPEALFARADQAVYAAKAAGRNRVWMAEREADRG